MLMVCTDAAARGIDIPHITHVVQSSFAASAVDFLHRVRVVAPGLQRHMRMAAGLWLQCDILLDASLTSKTPLLL